MVTGAMFFASATNTDPCSHPLQTAPHIRRVCRHAALLILGRHLELFHNLPILVLKNNSVADLIGMCRAPSSFGLVRLGRRLGLELGFLLFAHVLTPSAPFIQL